MFGVNVTPHDIGVLGVGVRRKTACGDNTTGCTARKAACDDAVFGQWFHGWVERDTDAFRLKRELNRGRLFTLTTRLPARMWGPTQARRR